MLRNVIVDSWTTHISDWWHFLTQLNYLWMYYRFLVTWHQNEYGMDALNIANWAAFLVLLIAKLPIVHRVRFFGINSD